MKAEELFPEGTEKSEIPHGLQGGYFYTLRLIYNRAQLPDSSKDGRKR